MIDTNPIDPYEHVRIEKIGDNPTELDKKKLEPQKTDKKLFLYLAFLDVLISAFRKISFTPREKEIENTPIKKELTTIKASLEALKTKNLSQDSEFLNYFAFIWLKFLKDFNYFLIKDKDTENKLRALISDLHDYPEGSEFSLGYYLSEIAGYKWIPFPYMEILMNLHKEYQEKHENSHLQKWINSFDEIIKSI